MYTQLYLEILKEALQDGIEMDPKTVVFEGDWIYLAQVSLNCWLQKKESLPWTL
jgi:hypothetical protein